MFGAHVFGAPPPHPIIAQKVLRLQVFVVVLPTEK